jgi:hypothetical protein
MSPGSAEDDAQARKARADAIRQARDERTARIEGDAEAGEDSPVSRQEDAGTGGHGPNFVDLIDAEMRKRRRE